MIAPLRASWLITRDHHRELIMARTGALLVAVALAAITASSASAAAISVTVGPGGSISYSPANATINAGDTVQWVWSTAFPEHSTTSGIAPTPDGIWDSGIFGAPHSFSHTFTSAGTFHYFCRVHGSAMTGTITVNADESPTAAFSVGTAHPVAGSPVSFDGSASKDPDGSITAFSWSFGDGSPAGSGAKPTHRYAAPGTYTVKLTVTDSAGHTATAFHQVMVT
jgi:plastocyanin